MRGSIGQLWAKALKADEELKKDYAKGGRNYTFQREFRLAWARRQFEMIDSVDQTVETAHEAETAKGRYLSLSQIVWEEKNKKSALNYMLFCVAQFRAGILYANKKAYVTYNEPRQVWQFWYTFEEYESGAGKK
jgi:hypothetical protein